MLPLRIIDLNFNLIDEITQYSSLQFTRKWHEIGEIELKINRYIRGANELTKDRIIFPHNHLHKAYQIKHREIELDENGKETENWLIKAKPLKAWLSQRLILPPSHTAYDNKQGNAETVMKHYVNLHAVNPVDSKRKIPKLVIAPNKNRGDSISRSSRFDVLSDEMTTISQLSGLGWNVVVDIKNKQFVFEVAEGVNRVASQRVNPPVIFSPEYNSLKNMEYTESYLDYKNMAYVAGQGEGVERRVITLNDTSTGLDRYELFVDARDVEETKSVDATDSEGDPTTEDVPRPEDEIIAELTDRGKEKLAEHEQEIYMGGQILAKSPFLYERDWDLGDIITVQNKNWGITMDIRITEIKEIYEVGNPKQIEVVFDKDKPTFIDIIKRQFKNMNPVIKS
ncbi:siphovirus ReqiPepy6 Gp37-like family protein [Rummeliibacillus stabekisii]|uniref:siphovirus ReqiPepy6 Gp37-like family protein n=1 Tax=Rummeliibacillus stabekisii TaxID=241244 RepID=UPI002040C073|nr:siphovirus ReqiPepy6 Gp37-like family protein [Rummeliibacillus stabekisii]MCM3316192.1 siphovirus ReqiPepy6 Gp37-like family protein [Rummeliibacillus stabekisii]